MKNKEIFIVAAILIAVVAFIYYYRRDVEGFDPQDMGGRKFFGFGREYGYSKFDVDSSDHCYQSTTSDACEPGYSRRINAQTSTIECCGNKSNYGS